MHIIFAVRGSKERTRTQNSDLNMQMHCQVLPNLLFLFRHWLLMNNLTDVFFLEKQRTITLLVYMAHINNFEIVFELFICFCILLMNVLIWVFRFSSLGVVYEFKFSPFITVWLCMSMHVNTFLYLSSLYCLFVLYTFVVKRALFTSLCLNFLHPVTSL